MGDSISVFMGDVTVWCFNEKWVFKFLRNSSILSIEMSKFKIMSVNTVAKTSGSNHSLANMKADAADLKAKLHEADNLSNLLSGIDEIDETFRKKY